MIWKDGKQQLIMFLEALNNYHPTIKFTHTMDKNEITFLDTIVYRSPTDRIYTSIYHKPTDQKQYLHYCSTHPRNQKESVPYGLLIRCRRICTEDYCFKEETKKIYNQIKYRKYPTNILNQAIQWVRNMDRLTLLRPTARRKPQNNIRFIINYNPRNPNLLQILTNLKDCY